MVLGITLVMMSACENAKPPTTAWPLDDGLDMQTPKILRVSPSDSALAGVGVIVLYGQYLSPQSQNNIVLINGQPTVELSSTDTSVTIESPSEVIGDSLTISTTVIGANEFDSFYPYLMIDPTIAVGEFGEFDDVYGLAVGTLENLYVSLGNKKIYQVTPAGEKTVYADITPLIKMDALRMGPDGYLYGVARRPIVYRIPPGGGNEEIFAVVSERVTDLDFDENGNMWTAGKGAVLFRVAPDASDSAMAEYPIDTEINALSVFDSYVYALGIYTGDDTLAVQSGLYRNQLNSDGSVGATELVLDFGDYFGTFVPVMMDMTFAADGDLYVIASSAVGGLVLHPPYDHSSIEEFYPRVLDPPNAAMVWGTGRYMYINYRPSGNDAALRAVYRVNLQKSGAPAFGR